MEGFKDSTAQVAPRARLPERYERKLQLQLEGKDEEWMHEIEDVISDKTLEEWISEEEKWNRRSLNETK